MHAFSVCDDPNYFYDYVQGLLDGLQAGVSSHDIVDIQNVGITSLARASVSKKHSLFFLFIFGFFVIVHSIIILSCSSMKHVFSAYIVDALALLPLTYSSSCLNLSFAIISVIYDCIMLLEFS